MRTHTPPDAILIPAHAEKVFSGKIFDIYQWQQQLFDGSTATFEMAKRPDTVTILAIHDDKIVIINDQQPHRPAHLSLPGGRHDQPHETELDAAKRELLEETGLSFHSWKLVDCHAPITETNKIEWLLYTFIAFDFDREVAPHTDPGEKISVQYLPYDELVNLSADPSNSSLHKFHPIIKSANSIDGLKNLPSLTK
ncbi:NUDIX hydrolase [Candidatus Saccharibacteria bacterium]|nr:NUDIX hydrolase [Candidatus Saccharibacteria bacterium]